MDRIGRYTFSARGVTSIFGSRNRSFPLFQQLFSFSSLFIGSKGYRNPRRRPPLTERSRSLFIGNTKARVVDERLSATNAVTAITRPANVLTLSAWRIIWIPWIRSTKKKRELRSSLLSFLNELRRARIRARNNDNQPAVAYTFRILPVPLLQRYSWFMNIARSREPLSRSRDTCNKTRRTRVRHRGYAFAYVRRYPVREEKKEIEKGKRKKKK